MQSFVLGPLEALVNRYVSLDAEATRLLKPLKKHTVGIEIQGLPVRLNMSFADDKITFHQQFNEAPSVHIAGSVFSLLGMVNRDAGIAGSVNVTGDVHVAEDFGKLFKELDIDWEEHLANIMGDIPARIMGNGLRSINDWAKQTFSTLGQNTAEYLQEELRYIPPSEELDDFYHEVDNLRDGVERIEAKIMRLVQVNGEIAH